MDIVSCRVWLPEGISNIVSCAKIEAERLRGAWRIPFCSPHRIFRDCMMAAGFQQTRCVTHLSDPKKADWMIIAPIFGAYVYAFLMVTSVGYGMPRSSVPIRQHPNQWIANIILVITRTLHWLLLPPANHSLWGKSFIVDDYYPDKSWFLIISPRRHGPHFRPSLYPIPYPKFCW
jgi:hypothetical protein